MHRVVSACPLVDHRLAVRFDDGTEGEIDLKDRLFGPEFEPLRDPELFFQIFIDDFGAIAWPNGADLAPDALDEQLRHQPAPTSRN